MIHVPTAENQTILFGVTSSQSLRLLGKIPTAIAKMGWNVHVVVGDTASEVPRDFHRIKTHILPMKRTPSLIRDISSFGRWILLLIKVRPDVVVIGTPKAALLGILASLICQVPVRIYQLRGLRLETVNGPARFLLYLLEWVTARTSTDILAVSPSLKEQYCNLGLSKANRVKVLGFGSSHGVDITYFNATRWQTWKPPQAQLRKSLESQTPILGFVGRLSKDKGSNELLECLNTLRKDKIEHTLLLIGPFEGNELGIDELDAFDQGVVKTGPLEDVAPYYAIMDLLLLPTHREGFPNVVLEAAASGVPAITTDATGAIDSVIDGETGLIFPVCDVEAFVEAVKRLVTNPQLIRELGENAQSIVSSRYGAEFVTQQYVDFITRKSHFHAQRN